MGYSKSKSPALLNLQGYYPFCKMIPKSFSLFAAILIISLVHFTQVLHAKENDDEPEFDYKKGSEKGPENWGKLKKEWAICNVGKMQSPIDLMEYKAKVSPSLGRLYTTYKPAKASLENSGHDIMLEWEEGAGALHLNDIEYNLKQCHWHSPSEHTINGGKYDLELHMVHESKDKKIAVIAVLYQLGHPDPFLAKLTDTVRKIANKKDEDEDVGIIDPMHIGFGRDEYFRYQGSLTTPGCDEGVTWTVIKQVMPVSKEQVELLRDALEDGFEDNARPLQALNDRPVYKSGPK